MVDLLYQIQDWVLRFCLSHTFHQVMPLGSLFLYLDLYLYLHKIRNWWLIMSLIRLVYTSLVSGTLSNWDIELILESARKNNFDQGVTGILYFNNNHFLQCLEGDREKVNALYNKIVNDERHHKVVILDYQEVHCRDFNDWSMGYIPTSSTTAPLALKFGSTHEFDPYSITGSSAYSLLIEMKKLLPSI